MGSMIRSPERLNTHVYVDFDGTIMSRDTTDFLLEAFALPAWHDVEAEWESGKIGSRECMARQIDLLRVTPDVLEKAVTGLEMTAGFKEFALWSKRAGLGMTIVSDGLDKVIQATLRRWGIDLPYFANHLVATGSDRWRLEFPNARSDCATGAGHCKCARTADKGQHIKIVIGDGRSDFCVAGRADLVLAKASLLKECQSKGIPHLPFADFHEVCDLLQGWLEAGPTTRRAGEQMVSCA
jgi:2-hydroxy-3-keto-5-methylthiopentenyl-1-phosphate phosphatase